MGALSITSGDKYYDLAAEIYAKREPAVSSHSVSKAAETLQLR